MAGQARQPVPPDEVVHYVSQRKGRRSPTRIQPPMTPMIDVTFLLLLFFIMTMQFRPAKGQIPADLPREQGIVAGNSTPLEPITIYLHKGATADQMPGVEISRHNVTIGSWEDLYANLKAIQEQFGSQEIPIIVQPDGNVPWASVINAYNQAVRGQFKTIGFAPTS